MLRPRAKIGDTSNDDERVKDKDLSTEQLVHRNTTAIRRASQSQADYVPHLRVEEVRDLARVASFEGLNGDRDSLFIKLVFDGCLRVSEALGVKLFHFQQHDGRWSVRITGKGDKYGVVAVSSSLVASIQAYAYRNRMDDMSRLFPFTRHRAYQIVRRAFDLSRIPKPPHVGAIHVLRHSGALARLAATGNPKAVQDHLRHVDAAMTIRYMKTLQAEESLKIQQGVDFGW